METVKTISHQEVSEILAQSLLEVDKNVSQFPRLRTQGSTACVVYMNQDKNGESSMITANIGDSRAVLSRDQHAIELSVDHKPNLPGEKARIESFGGFIKWDGKTLPNGQPDEATGVWRVNGNLALSRALGTVFDSKIIIYLLGDVYLKPFVTASPDITLTKCSPNDEFVISKQLFSPFIDF
jgi:protein phosphatase 2C